MEIPRLSLCMIVKNEEKVISRCLHSIKDVVDEMIIVDTGSTDQTIEICKSFGATVLDFPWNGNFSDARNFGVNRANGDWILWLDADEEVDKGDRLMLRDLLYSESFDIIAVHLINFYGDKLNPDHAVEIAHYRLFRNGMGIQFANRIHEVLQAPDDLKLRERGRIGYTDLKLYHYGYMDQTVAGKDKHNRNLQILEKELNDGEGTPWTHYYIAAEYSQMKKYKEAFEHVNLALFEFLMSGHIPPPSILYKLKYSIIISTGSWEGAVTGIEKAVALYPDYVELRYQLGVILYFNQEWTKAIEVFDECIRLGEGNLTHLITKGVGSFHSWYFKGLCYHKLGKKEDAIVCFAQAVVTSNGYEEALLELKKTLIDCIFDEHLWEHESLANSPKQVRQLLENLLDEK